MFQDLVYIVICIYFTTFVNEYYRRLAVKTNTGLYQELTFYELQFLKICLVMTNTARTPPIVRTAHTEHCLIRQKNILSFSAIQTEVQLPWTEACFQNLSFTNTMNSGNSSVQNSLGTPHYFPLFSLRWRIHHSNRIPDFTYDLSYCRGGAFFKKIPVFPVFCILFRITPFPHSECDAQLQPKQYTPFVSLVLQSVDRTNFASVQE